MPQALLFMIVIALAAAVFFAVKAAGSSNARKRKALKVKAQKSWKSATKVQELISLYLDVLLTHGPDSREAKAFRFGVDNSELWTGNDALDSFITMTEICDSVVRRHKTWKKR